MTKFVPADQSVRDDIVTTLDASLCVEAGAGTGKTTVLVQRIVELLRTGTAAVDDLVVMTFTENAAAELAGRVRDGLEQALANADDGESKERLAAALHGLYRAHIETIHAFAGSILHERPVEARLDPQFQVLDRLGSELSFDLVYDDWLAATLEKEDEALSRALNRGFDLSHMKEAAETLHRFRYLLPMTPIPAPTADLASFGRELSERCEELREHEPSCMNEDDAGFEQIPTILDFGKRWEEAHGDAAELERILLFRTPRVRKNAGVQANWNPASACKAVKGVFGWFRDETERLEAELRAEALAGVIPLVEGFVRDYEDRRRAEGVADFDDLLIWARDLLRDDIEVRRWFQDRYSRVLIDEFQDTDPIQAEIALFLTSDGQDSQKWEELAPAPGKLFVVGDPKQSIYRFRRADIAIYDAVKRGALADGLREISQNFRSLAGVLEWANDAFDQIFDEEEGIQPRNVRLDAAPAALELERAPVIVLHSEPADTLADTVRREEARLIAETIRRAVRDEHWPVRDRVTKEQRPAEWRDIAILFPARTGLDLHEDALATAGVPYRLEGGRMFFHRREVRELTSLLQAIDDPTDQLHLVAALRSLAFGCSDEDVFMWLAGGRRLDFRGRNSGEPETVGEALDMIQGLHRQRRGLSLAEFVRRVVEELGLVEVALTLPDGDQVAANLLKVVEQARAFAGSGGGGVRAFARWLEAHREIQADEADAGVVEEGDDAVRLATIHAAKGLEFPIVALANLNGQERRQDKPIPDATKRELHMRVGTRGTGVFATPGYDDAVDREKHAERAEKLRLLYVAATRTRDHLLLPVVGPPDRPATMLAALLPSLPTELAEQHGQDADGCHVYDTALLERELEEAEPESQEISDSQVADAIARKEAWEEDRRATIAAARRGLTVSSASSVKREHRPLTAIPGGSGETIDVELGPPLPMGDAVHRVMEMVELPGAGNLGAAVTAACAEFGVVEYSADVQAMAQRCLESELLKRALQSASLRREVPFTVPCDGTGFATGRMDAVFVEEGELVIADYKTDNVAAEQVDEVLERHRPQAALYAWSTQAATGLPVREVVFVFARLGVEGSIAVDDELLTEGERISREGVTLPPEPAEAA